MCIFLQYCCMSRAGHTICLGIGCFCQPNFFEKFLVKFWLDLYCFTFCTKKKKKNSLHSSSNFQSRGEGTLNRICKQGLLNPGSLLVLSVLLDVQYPLETKPPPGQTRLNVRGMLATSGLISLLCSFRYFQALSKEVVKGCPSLFQPPLDLGGLVRFIGHLHISPLFTEWLMKCL